MRKPTKSSLTVKLDKEFSRYIRSQGICAKCGECDYSKLQCAHIYSRTYKSVRWDLSNLLCLCAKCHFWAHKNPILFAEFVIGYLGELKCKELTNRKNSIKRWTAVEMEELLKTFKVQ